MTLSYHMSDGQLGYDQQGAESTIEFLRIGDPESPKSVSAVRGKIIQIRVTLPLIAGKLRI